MSKYVPDSTLNAFLNVIANAGVKISLCSTQPTNYTEANATYSLGSKTLTAGSGNGSYLIADGDVSGRKLTILQQTGISVTATGSAQHVAITDGASVLYAVTTLTAQTVTSGNTATINTFDIEIADAV